MNVNLDAILNAYRRLGFRVFNDGIDYCLNIGGIRATDLSGDTFNDMLYCFYTHGGNMELHLWAGTVDPGITALKLPINELGTGLLMRGQYPDSHMIGLHKGKYRALVQRGLLTVARDFNKDDVRDITPPDHAMIAHKTIGGNRVREYYRGGELLFRSETGSNFGLNVHHAGEDSTQIGRWSYACQVHKAISSFDEMMALVDASLYLRGNDEKKFKTGYTLLHESDIENN